MKESKIKKELSKIEERKRIASASISCFCLGRLAYLASRLNSKNLKLMIFEKNPDTLIQTVKRSLLYTDFVIAMPPLRQTDTIINNQIPRKSPGIYFKITEDDSRNLINFSKITEKDLGVYFPFFFINCHKCSSETEVIVNDNHFTLGQFYSLLHLTIGVLIGARRLPSTSKQRKIESVFLSNLDATKFLLKHSPVLKEEFPNFAKGILTNSLLLFGHGLEYGGNSVRKCSTLIQNPRGNKLPIIQTLISMNLPFLEKISLEDLIKTRIREMESFISFRKALFDAVQQFKKISPHENPKKTAKRIKEDILLPELIKLNYQFKKIITYRAFRMAIFTTTPLILNIIPGNIAYEIIAKASYSILSKTALESIEFWKEIQEIKENKIYFLWKLSRHSDTKFSI